MLSGRLPARGARRRGTPSPTELVEPLQQPLEVLGAAARGTPGVQPLPVSGERQGGLGGPAPRVAGGGVAAGEPLDLLASHQPLVVALFEGAVGCGVQAHVDELPDAADVSGQHGRECADDRPHRPHVIALVAAGPHRRERVIVVAGHSRPARRRRGPSDRCAVPARVVPSEGGHRDPDQPRAARPQIGVVESEGGQAGRGFAPPPRCRRWLPDA